MNDACLAQPLTARIKLYTNQLLAGWNSTNSDRPVVMTRIDAHDRDTLDELVDLLGISKAEFIRGLILRELRLFSGIRKRSDR